VSGSVEPTNDSTTPDDPSLQLGSVQSSLMRELNWTDPQTGSLGLGGVGLDQFIYTYNVDIAF